MDHHGSIIIHTDRCCSFESPHKGHAGVHNPYPSIIIHHCFRRSFCACFGMFGQSFCASSRIIIECFHMLPCLTLDSSTHVNSAMRTKNNQPIPTRHHFRSAPFEGESCAKARGSRSRGLERGSACMSSSWHIISIKGFKYLQIIRFY